MKKFLSLVLALVLTMSLVVVPANATEGESASEPIPASEKLTVETTATAAYVGDNVTYTAKLPTTVAGKQPSDVSYNWTVTDVSSAFEHVTTTDQPSVTLVGKTAGKSASLTCTAIVTITDDDTTTTKYYSVSSDPTNTLTVKDVYEITGLSSSITLTLGTKPTAKLSPKLMELGEEINEGETFNFNFRSDNEAVAKVEADGKVTAVAKGEATITVEAAYKGKTIGPVTVNVKVELPTLAITLGEVKNGNNDYLYASSLESAVVAALKMAVPSYSGNKTVSELKVRTNNLPGGRLYKKDGTTAITPSDNLVGSDVYYTKFAATPGYLGKVAYTITAVIDGDPYTGTMTIPVVSAGDIGKDIYAYVTSSNSVSFELPSGYDTLYYKQGSVSSYDGDWTYANGWSTCSSSVKGTLPLSSFSNTGKTTISAVGIAGGVAYTGTLTVVLNSYNIEYSGVAGETITFDQDDFEDFMEEAAEDYGWINTSSSSTAYVKFNHVIFSIPDEKTQGILYNDGEQIKFNSNSSVKECTDLDEVSFAIADKTGLKEVVINFTLYADYYSSERVNYPATKTFSGRVVVNVVHEDIKYTVPVDGSVVFKAEDFQDFFDDTYRTGTLSYVKFTELPKVTDGALYATYSAIYAGTVAEESDKFYYDSSKISDYDLDDVTFRTSLWSKAGTKVYIPFTAYGTKSYQSVDGWVVITVENARTMNFTDVKTGDWFYNNVKNAYSMGLIEGKTTTTFNPNDNMTYAEAVTLAARMNQLYYSGKVTLSNSTTGNWYSSYESYAISKGIISSALGNKANTKITRKDYVDIFYNALPASAYTVRNTVSKIPDLANNTANAKVYAFYRAGILTGYANTPGKTNGAFGPNDNIKRSEVATILIRMMDSGTRVYFTL